MQNSAVHYLVLADILFIFFSHYPFFSLSIASEITYNCFIQTITYGYIYLPEVRIISEIETDIVIFHIPFFTAISIIFCTHLVELDLGMTNILQIF